MQILTITLHTVDNLRFTVPNSKIMQDTITNYSVMPTRRIQLTVGMSYDDDLQDEVASSKGEYALGFWHVPEFQLVPKESNALQ